MGVDLSKVQVGDRVTVSLLARERSASGGMWFDSPFGETTDRHGLIGIAGSDAILSHEPAPPKPLGVGDKVTRCNGGRTRGVIKHVIDGRAWVGWSSGQQLIHQLADLYRVVGSGEAVAAQVAGDKSLDALK